MSVLLEDNLLHHGFTLIKGDLKCDHNEYPWYLWYVQDCECCSYEFYKNTNKLQSVQSKDLPWYKYYGCEKCMDTHLSSLFCGGHYSNFRIYKIDENTEIEYDCQIDRGQHDIEPHTYVYIDYITDT